MKKTYISPVMETVGVKMTCHMLAGSLDKFNDDTVTDDSEILSREFSKFEEEEAWSDFDFE